MFGSNAFGWSYPAQGYAGNINRDATAFTLYYRSFFLEEQSMKKNVATKWIVFAFTTADNLPKTGDAANITANVRIDAGAANAVDDTNPTELEDGYYCFDITAAECNGDNIVICPASTTAGVQVIGVPGAVWTINNFSPSADTVATVTNLTNDYAKYMGGAVWIDTVNGAAGSTSYVNGIMSNPVTTIADAKTIADNLKLKQFWIQAGSAVTLAADYPGYMFNGKGYTLALGGHNISSAQIERVEGLSGIGTCATGEAVFHYCHLNTMSIGEADFNYCHLNGIVTLTQASVPYLFNTCTGIVSANITFAAAGQTTVISRWGGTLTIAGMVAGNTLILDGNGDVTLDNTNTGGTVYVSGNIVLTNNGSGQTVNDTSRFNENQNITNVTGTVNALAAQAKADVNAEADTALTDYGALKPTTAGRTLDITATGAAGIDWGNIENKLTTNLLSNTDIANVNAVLSSVNVGSLAAVGISFSDETNLEMKIGTPATGSISGDIAALPTAASIAALPTDADNAAAILAAAALAPIASNIKQVNDTTIQGTGAVGTDEWRKV
jgi:hypothetical protein